MGMAIEDRNRIAKRAAAEIEDGMVVNLGIGIPSLVLNHLQNKNNIMFHSENGIIGMGPSPKKGEEDENLCNAAGYPVTIRKGASYFDSTIAFAIARREKLDVTILGALEVSETGDIANWIVPGNRVPGMGGAMELAKKAKKVIVVMSHFDKYGNSKIVPSCSLPLTASSCVDLIITNVGVFHVTKNGLILTDIFLPYTVNEAKKQTTAKFSVSPTLAIIE
ncbi:3-oxoacid CoA-transferase subunit B [Caldibacillus lycopersici]|uniref:3-oxoacid CoA-transferase subunit B n=1 Tax=Perspicuibacillus lycopersici TaxID=1325689 RepID=A0AAE3IUG1_9BACI|nr:3-oxoacid CoA-transferase subunit B [Perspicuibacillus lycopersici]MCU9613624.1 3-oxoacid CoA-transferase subunit B [Perspicuibacillus lycopersici]